MDGSVTEIGEMENSCGGRKLRMIYFTAKTHLNLTYAANNHSANGVEYLHDFRLVWSFKIQRITALASGPHKLGDCIYRVLFYGACKQVWIKPGNFCISIEDDTGSDHVDCICRLCSHVS